MALYYGRKAIRKAPGIVIREVPIPEPVVTQGFGTREQTGQICRDAGYRSVLLVTDETLYGLGMHEKVAASLEACGIAYEIFHGISGEPDAVVIEEGRKAAVACRADCIVALGGGSVLDSGKIIAAGSRHPGMPISAFLHKFAPVTGGTLPMIGIPTTAGTGAECTVGAVVKNSHGVKAATVVVGLKVPHVILDSELIIHAPKAVTVWCAIDALSHGLEGLLADVEPDSGDIFKSRECVRLIFENLPLLLRDPENVEARQATLLAAHYGGNAINRQLAGYVHAFAHSIGALYHIPHGKAIAWCLMPIVAYQKDIRREEMAALSEHCGFAGPGDSREEAADKFLKALQGLLDTCGLEKECRLLQEKDYDRLTGMIDADSINYAPSKTLKDQEIRILLDQIRKGDRQ